VAGLAKRLHIVVMGEDFRREHVFRKIRHRQVGEHQWRLQ